VTVECLADVGYAGATAQVIAKRAGLSRGAQLHHFGNKRALVIQAMEHLFERRLEAFRGGIAELPTGDDFTSAVLDLLWEMVSGAAGHAYLELVVASRTDPELREAMIDLTKRMDAQVERAFDDLFEAPPGGEGLFEVGWTALFALMEGLAIEKIVRPDDRRLDDVLALLKRLAPMVMSARP
jgi:AcrR family transcriptional regulator